MNVYNILAAAAAGFARGCSTEAISRGVAALTHVPGRFQRVDCGQPFTVVVDYAHTDDALRNLTALAREFVSRSGAGARVITLFGCGGDRDRAKRPLMGEAAGRGSDFVVLTSDNPRSEDPRAIINDALVGLQKTGTKYAVEVDRRKGDWRSPLAKHVPGTSSCWRAKATRRCRSRAKVLIRSTMWKWQKKFCEPPDSTVMRSAGILPAVARALALAARECSQPPRVREIE